MPAVCLNVMLLVDSEEYITQNPYKYPNNHKFGIWKVTVQYM